MHHSWTSSVYQGQRLGKPLPPSSWHGPAHPFHSTSLVFELCSLPPIDWDSADYSSLQKGLWDLQHFNPQISFVSKLRVLSKSLSKKEFSILPSLTSYLGFLLQHPVVKCLNLFRKGNIPPKGNIFNSSPFKIRVETRAGPHTQVPSGHLWN